MLVQRIEAERLLGVFDRTFEGLIVFEKLDKTRNNLSRALAETFPVRINPLAGTVGEDVAFYRRAASCRAARSPASPRSAAASNATRSTTASALRATRASGIPLRPGHPAPATPLGGGAARGGGSSAPGYRSTRPEGARDALTLDRTGAGMEYQESDELLLPHARRTCSDTAVLQDSEPSKQLDP